MTVSLKHAFQSAKTDSSDSTIVQPSNWNEEHELTAAAGVVLGRNTSSAGVVQELPIAVTAAGNVGIGTTTPGQKLTVAGTIESTSGGFKFPDGSTQTVAAVSGVSYPQNAQNGNYTLVLADAGKQIYSANTAVQTITIPTNASVAFPIGTLITIINRGTSQILLGTTGVSVIANGSAAALTYNSIAPNNAVQLLKTGTNTWDSMFGTFAATLRSHLIVAGGGGGGGVSAGGGGGAGGAVAGTSIFATGTLTVTIGGGGAAGGNNAYGVSGTNSTVTGLTTAVGGGGGGAGGVGYFGLGGGSGGGGGADGTNVVTGGAGTGGQGNGGGSTSTNYAGGGGGGGGAVGATAIGTTAGNGGAGVASTITGSSVTYAGGGAGGQIYSATAATGGSGGGGAGGTSAANAVAGTANLGGGGGAGGASGRVAAAGGSGVVIISSPIAAISTTGSPTITTSTGNTIYTFNSSGTITF